MIIIIKIFSDFAEYNTYNAVVYIYCCLFLSPFE